MAQIKQILQGSVIRAQLIPLNGMQMVLPNTCIAEIIEFQQPKKIDDAPEWLLGLIVWRDISIPIISFEAINGVAVTQIQKSTRIIVLNNISGDDNQSFYGIIAQNIPRLLTLNKDDISSITEPDTMLPFAIQQTIINDQLAIIPNQEQIEDALKKQNIN